MKLILASTSPYRQDLLRRLQLSFQTARPEVDETPLHSEPPIELAERLARAKAAHIAAAAPDAWVIGSDQVAALNGEALGKPGTRERAIAQLTAMSGHSVRFHTAVCLAHGDRRLTATDLTHVSFRKLDQEEIVRYVDTEQPLDCAGSFKSEGLGIALFDSIESHDPTALIGLPLITLSKLLRQAGFRLP